MLGDPVGQAGTQQFGMRDDGPARDLAVVLDVVARQDRRRGDAAVAAPGQGLTIRPKTDPGSLIW